MTKKEILEMTGLSEEEFYRQYPTEESWTESYKKGGWIQKATASIKRRGTEGVCTGSKFGGPTCRPGTKRYNLAKTFRKMAKSRKEEGGYVDMYEEGGMVDAYQLMGMPTPEMYEPGGKVRRRYKSPDRTDDNLSVIRSKSTDNLNLPDEYAASYDPNSLNLGIVDAKRYNRALGLDYNKSFGPFTAGIRGGVNKETTPTLYQKKGTRYEKVKEGEAKNILFGGLYGRVGTSIAPDLDTNTEVISFNPSLEVGLDKYGNSTKPYYDASVDVGFLNNMGSIGGGYTNRRQPYAVSLPSEGAGQESYPYAGASLNVPIVRDREGNPRLIVAGGYNIPLSKNTPDSGYAGLTYGFGKGGLIKRKDGSYSRRGLWDNIRANRGSGKKPTAEMLKQERKIRAAEKKEYGGMVNMYGMGGTTNIGDLSHVISAKNFPNMGYAMGGPVMYDFGSVVKDIGAGLYGAGEGLLDTVTMGATDQLTDAGYKGLQKLGGSSESEMRQQDSIRGYGMAAGAITGGILNPASAASAIQQGAKGVGMGVSKGSPNSKFAQGVGTYLPMAGNLAGMAAGAGAFGDIGGGAAGSAQSAEFAKSGFGQFAQGAGQVGKGYNQFGGMMGGDPMSMLGMLGMPMAMGGAVNAPNMMQYADGGLLGMGGINKFSGLFADGGLLGLGGVNKFSGLMPFADGGLLGIRGMNKFSGLIPNFARGGMTGPLTEINVEKGELLTDEDGRIVTKYRGGGMVPHPEEGMDERGTVPAQEGMFVITKAQAKNYEKAMNNSDKLYADAIRNNISYDKAKKEAAEEQAAMTAMDKFVAKYGGAVRRMYAKGGMVPMYDLGGGTGGLNINNPAFGNVDMSAFGFGNTPSSLNLDSSPMTMGQYLTGQSGSYMDYRNIPNTGISYKGTDTSGTSTSDGDMSNFGKYAPYAMQGIPIAWNLIQGMKKPTKVPGDLGAMSTALEAPKMSGEAGRRALAREGAAARYAWRQAGAQAGPAALTALTNARMGRIADFEEGLRNAQAQMDYQAAAQRKAYEQFNAQQAMNRYMLQAQADAVPTQYTAAGMGQLGQMGESILNRQLLKQLEG